MVNLLYHTIALGMVIRGGDVVNTKMATQNLPYCRGKICAMI